MTDSSFDNSSSLENSLTHEFSPNPIESSAQNSAKAKTTGSETFAQDDKVY